MSTMMEAANEMAAELVKLGRHDELDGMDVRLHVMPSASRRAILAVAEFPGGEQAEAVFFNPTGLDPDNDPALGHLEQHFERELGRRLLSLLVKQHMQRSQNGGR